MQLGLENVIVAETKLSEVNGLEGKLTVCGLDSADLEGCSYEGISELLLGESYDYGAGRLSAFRKLRPYFSEFQTRGALESLSLGLSALSENAGAADIIGAIPIILGAVQHGNSLQQPDPKQTHVSDFLRLWKAEKPSAEEVLALEKYLVTVAEHGLNASTFTCRVVASTKASRKMATLAALGALSGPLHGGAPGPVLDLLDELRLSEDIRLHLLGKVHRGERLMGFGHRVYKTRDPRASLLKMAVSTLNPSPRLAFSEKVEKVAEEVLAETKPDRALKTNVEFYTAILLDELGFERSWFTCLFAMGRVLGWMAHYQEQRDTGRLMRPKARYIGVQTQRT